ncbi:MAG: sulfatase-like hydrolase/transferase, partial [Planctomycetota bacterium]
MAKGILLIVIDCLRADHVSRYGYDHPTTPTLDELASRGTLWTRAHSVSSWTKPAVTSLLTGLYPREHGAYQGIKRSKGRSWATTDVLVTAQPTLAESLTAAGWRCGAFLNNAQLDEFTRLNRGFERYTSDAGQADRLFGIFEEWLRAKPGNPWFAYLHLLEAHWPYKPRRRHVALFGGNRDTNRFREFSARDFGRLRHSVHQGEKNLTDNDREELIQMYDGAVRRLDGKLRTLLKTLR